MASLNRVFILGNLGSDPELSRTATGNAVTHFRVATNEQWTDKDGNRQERTEWHRITVWGRQAERCKDYLAKGRSVFIEGRLQTRQWEDRNGQKRYTTEIVASNVQFLSGGGGPRGQDQPGRAGGDPVVDVPQVGGDAPPDNIADDDVPF